VTYREVRLVSPSNIPFLREVIWFSEISLRREKENITRLK
jgi:hypothetical protein